ncbi:MAG TPA: hypothetical protein DD473_21690 [Planctomycetaceae bacterium]|nr:hypothetical protein [Planctomycetaceae bacterium]
MSYLQIHQVIDRIQGLHTQFGRELAALVVPADDPQGQMILKTIRDCEKHFENRLLSSIIDQDPAIMETWVQFIPDEEIQGFFQMLDPAHAKYEEDLLVTTHLFFTSLSVFYHQIAQQLQGAEMVTFLEDLAKFTEEQNAMLAWKTRDSDLHVPHPMNKSISM